MISKLSKAPGVIDLDAAFCSTTPLPDQYPSFSSSQALRKKGKVEEERGSRWEGKDAVKIL